MNILILGERDIYYRSPHYGDELVSAKQVIEFDAISTKKDDTFRILNSNDPASEYINVVRETTDSETAELHVRNFKNWIDSCNNSGYKIIWEMI